MVVLDFLGAAKSWATNVTASGGWKHTHFDDYYEQRKLDLLSEMVVRMYGWDTHDWDTHGWDAHESLTKVIDSETLTNVGGVYQSQR